ncbi:MAG: FAD-binding protein [Bacteroidota bacterium]|nr:FAD-binding protein [Bacteroidota bacterium]MDE2958014.1 FAD-binding protein [Bacteroidota bacterium]
MDKRTFLKTSSALLLGSVLAPLSGCTRPEELAPIRTNWAGNLTYSTDQLLLPTSMDELQHMVRSHDHVRPLGSRHCFNPIADSREAQLSLAAMPQTVTFGTDTITVPGAMRYGDTVPHLDERGLALHNLASLPHISVAGALATATHGSGVSNGNLATAAVAMEVVMASGDRVTITPQDAALFRAAAVGLGCFGVVSSVTLRVEPTYDMMQHVYLNLPLPSIDEHFAAIMGLGYSVSIFTDWRTPESTQVWVKRRIAGDLADLPTEMFGAVLADRNVHPVLALSADACTDQMGVPGAWHARLPHFKMDFTPSSGEELQSEYFVDRQHAPDVIGVLRDMADQLNPLLMISEVRTIAADDLLMSTAGERDSVAFHFTWHQDWKALQALLPALEAKLAPFAARPHWGKNFLMSHDVLQSLYPAHAQFQELVLTHDPEGKFRNNFVNESIIHG